jgi:hypothetical protein
VRFKYQSNLKGRKKGGRGVGGNENVYIKMYTFLEKDNVAMTSVCLGARINEDTD